MKRTLIWFRNDLRITDHEALHKASIQQNPTLGVYCFDPRNYTTLEIGFPKTGSFRAQFILESVTHLKQLLQTLGSDLIVVFGKPEEIVPSICAALTIELVTYQKEIAPEEVAIEDALESALLKQHIQTTTYWNSTLMHPEDLPFPIQKLSELFTDFRKKVERETAIRNSLPAPTKLVSINHNLEFEEVTLKMLGLEKPQLSPLAVLDFKGGEAEAQKRLNHYFWDTNHISQYKETRNRMLGESYSSKFSPWLALGCISARSIYHEVKKYEQERVQNDSTYWLVFELLWRDYFKWIAAKHKGQLFQLEGLQKLQIQWREDEHQFMQWRTGNTGYPIIDANMRELLQTGFISNRGRQLVASFLTKNLGINWLWGAQWFESQLIDYDVCSNYGNWNYAAGVGNDARGFRYFNILKQAHDYDANGMYVKHWLPELRLLPDGKVHQPYKMAVNEKLLYDFELGKNYSKPMIDLDLSVKEIEGLYNMALKDRRTKIS
ncbi:MAG: DASH family cryptochrome [Bacteroidia bacterium]|jgi:deoxyribodipyrimidine photo-lyase|nr:DASH family cryptochrome [Bacteroidia bacterium]